MIMLFALLAVTGAVPWHQPYLPDVAGGWKAAAPVRTHDRSNLFDYMDGAGELYLAYDFREIAVREYEKPDSPRITAEVYLMSSARDAYGVYTADRSPGAAPEEVRKIGQDRDYGAGLLRLWKSNYFVRILADRETPESKAAVLGLGKQISASIKGEGTRPTIIKLLPTKGLVADSIRYFHAHSVLNYHYYLSDENILNLSAKTDCVLARYQLDGSRPRLLIISYPSSANASRAFASFNKAYFKDKPAPKGVSRVEPVEKGLFTGIRLDGRLLRLAFDARSRQQATALISH